MSDVLQTAVNYRNRLKTEIARVDDFLRMAEEFSNVRDLDQRLAFSKPAAGAQPADQLPVDRLRPAARPAASA